MLFLSVSILASAYAQEVGYTLHGFIPMEEEEIAIKKILELREEKKRRIPKLEK